MIEKKIKFVERGRSAHRGGSVATRCVQRGVDGDRVTDQHNFSGKYFLLWVMAAGWRKETKSLQRLTTSIA